MSGSKTKSTTNSNQTQTSAPPSWTMPGISQAASDVTAALGQIPTSHYSGQQIAYLDPSTLAGIQGAYGNTADLASQYTNWMGNQLGALSTPYSFTTALPDTTYNVGSMADVNPVIDAALHPLYQQLTEQILPSIKSSALDSGAYTGDRAMMVLPQQALQAYTDSASRTAAQIGYQNYNDYENRRLAAFQAATGLGIDAYTAETQRGLGQEGQNANMLGATADYISNILHNSASVGDLLKMSADLGVQNQQAQIDNALAMDKYASYSPFMGLDEASQLLAQLSGGWGTTNQVGHSTTTQTQTPGALDWIKAGIGAAGLVAGIPFGGAAAAAAAPIAISPTAGAQAASAMANTIFR